MVELVINWKTVRRLGLSFGWFRGDNFALAEVAIWNVVDCWIDILHVKFLKFELNLFLEQAEK